jgi:hydrogenase maturation protease
VSTRPDPSPVPALLVLGLGNRLLTDDGLGLELLARVTPRLAADPRVELVDGGTQGLALLGLLEGRSALLLLDAVARGSGPGAVHHLRGTGEVVAHRSGGAHEGNAGELLAVARLVGDLPEVVEVVGIEPVEVRTGIGLSGPVRAALEPAAGLALQAAERLLASMPVGRAACTS